jgi:two-component system chemotaxis response regulator CheY
MARILFIDDNQQIQNFLPVVLEERGHQVVSAANGKQGLAILRQQPIDLILTDVLMPEMDGLEVLQAVRREFAHVPVIAISGGSNRLEGRDALQLARLLGAKATLSKPFQIADLLTIIRCVLSPESINRSPTKPPNAE